MESVGPNHGKDQELLAHELIITLEPDVLGDGVKCVFCCWILGTMVCEIDPSLVFRNLLSNNWTPNHHPDHSPEGERSQSHATS